MFRIPESILEARCGITATARATVWYEHDMMLRVIFEKAKELLAQAELEPGNLHVTLRIEVEPDA